MTRWGSVVYQLGGLQCEKPLKRGQVLGAHGLAPIAHVMTATFGFEHMRRFGQKVHEYAMIGQMQMVEHPSGNHVVPALNGSVLFGYFGLHFPPCYWCCSNPSVQSLGVQHGEGYVQYG